MVRVFNLSFVGVIPVRKMKFVDSFKQEEKGVYIQQNLNPILTKSEIQEKKV